MSDELKRGTITDNGDLKKSGYEPLNEGYEPRETEQDREYTPPEGGSGESDSDNQSED